MKGYLFICRLAQRRHGITPLLYPVSFNRFNATLSIGKPTSLDNNKDYKSESKRVDDYLLEQVILGYTEPERMASGVIENT